MSDFKWGQKLVADMEHYRAHVYNHRKPCEEWKKTGWCKHFVQARAKMFHNEILGLLSDITTPCQHLNLLEKEAKG